MALLAESGVARHDPRGMTYSSFFRRSSLVAHVPLLISLAACEGTFTSRDDGGDSGGQGGDGGDGSVGSGGDGGGASGGSSGGLSSNCPGEFLRAVSVAAGEQHACAVDASTRAVWCWGAGESGQLGNAVSGSVSGPVQADTDDEFTSVVALGVSTCALRDDGTLFCWGNNFDGVLADGSDQSQNVPVETAMSVGAFSGAAGSVLALTDEGGLVVWGSNAYGQLGLGDASSGDEPIRIETTVPLDEVKRVTQVTSGGTHSCFLDSDGVAFCTGSNGFSELGFEGPNETEFTLVSDELLFTQIAAGKNRTCAITQGDELYCWGSNTPTILPGRPGTLTRPLQLGDDHAWKSVSVGFDHVCALDVDGALFCIGDNEQGELGDDGEARQLLTPVLEGERFSAVSAGWHSTCALRSSDGAVLCFGSNEYLQLGRADAASSEPNFVCLPTFTSSGD